MDSYDATKMVYSRLQTMEPDHVSKIMGYLLLQDGGEQEMFRLAFSNDASLQALVMKIKKDLGLSSSANNRYPNPLMSAEGVPPFSAGPSPRLPFGLGGQSGMPPPSSYASAPAIDLFGSSFLHGLVDAPHPDLSLRSPLNHLPIQRSSRMALSEQMCSQDRFASEYQLRSDLQLLNHHSLANDSQDFPYFPPEMLSPESYSIMSSRLGEEGLQHGFDVRSYSSSDLSMSPDSLGSAAAWKPCVYYARGFCRHGSSCKFLHSHVRPDSGLLISPNNGRMDPGRFMISPSKGKHDTGSDDGISPGSLDRLEYEITELLRGRKAPVSIASLPQLYYERFGKTLQADGYMTESQRHGKAGYSLTKLLARLKNSITLIDRPHGQHAVVLAEDALKFTAYRGEKDVWSGVNPGSRQIYLTFPADSAFSEDDVSSYFRVFGPVQDVRIPYQQKRMFGFVTFVYPETVKMILANGNPHYICGARVLVKPYKEKGKHVDRKYADVADYPRFRPGQHLDMGGFDNVSGPRFLLEQGLLRKQLEEQEMIVEMERKRLQELQLEKHRMQQLLSYPIEESQQAPPSGPSAALQTALSEVSSVFTSSSDYGSIREDVDVLPEDLELKPIQTNARVEDLVGYDITGDRADKQSDDEHNLPSSPFTFTSPRKPQSPAFDERIASSNSNSSTKSMVTGGPPPGFSLPSVAFVDQLNCHSCKA